MRQPLTDDQSYEISILFNRAMDHAYRESLISGGSFPCLTIIEFMSSLADHKVLRLGTQIRFIRICEEIIESHNGKEVK